MNHQTPLARVRKLALVTLVCLATAMPGASAWLAEPAAAPAEPLSVAPADASIRHLAVTFQPLEGRGAALVAVPSPTWTLVASEPAFVTVEASQPGAEVIRYTLASIPTGVATVDASVVAPAHEGGNVTWSFTTLPMDALRFEGGHALEVAKAPQE